MKITKLLEREMSLALLMAAAAMIATPMPVLAQAAPGTVAYPSCDPGAAPLNNAMKADWQAYCAKQAGQAVAAPAAPSYSYPYCNPEAAPPDPRVRAEWQASCAAQQQQSQGATP